VPLAESLGHARALLRRRIDHDRKQERPVVRHLQRAIHCQTPFKPEVTLAARLGVGGDDRHEQRAIADLLTDAVVPGISAAQLVTVEPGLEPGGGKPGGQALRRLLVVARVADKDRLRSIDHLEACRAVAAGSVAYSLIYPAWRSEAEQCWDRRGRSGVQLRAQDVMYNRATRRV